MHEATVQSLCGSVAVITTRIDPFFWVQEVQQVPEVFARDRRSSGCEDFMHFLHFLHVR